MHRLVQDQIEEVLAGRTSQECLTHLASCPECCAAVARMRGDSQALRSLKVDAEPRAGFYARVMERIETQRAASIWNLFFESIYGRRIAIASLALVLLVGVYIVTSESTAEEALLPAPASQELPETQLTAFPAGLPVDMSDGGIVPVSAVLPGGMPDQDSVLQQIVTYQVQIVQEDGPLVGAPSQQ
jgi:anti-sigma factor RsiW